MRYYIAFYLIICTVFTMNAQIQYDTYPTNSGELKVFVIGHGSLMFEYKDKIIHVDPFSQVADYSILPKADLILITHEHADHLDTTAISCIRKPTTQFILSKVCYEILNYGTVIENGDSDTFEDIVSIDATPAYNIVNKKPDGTPYHPIGRGNGYVLTFDGLKVYVAGDTENIPEMKDLMDISIAFLPKNIPYTMTDEMFIDAALMITPQYLYPYHFSEINEEFLSKSLDQSGITICIRPMVNK